MLMSEDKGRGLFMSNTKQFYLNDCSINDVIDYLNLKEDEIEEINLKYIWTAESLNLNKVSFQTIFDEEDKELSCSFNNLSDFIIHIIAYEDYFDIDQLDLKITFQYTEYYNDFDCRIAEILCVRN